MNPLRDHEPSGLATTAEAYLTGQLAVCVRELRILIGMLAHAARWAIMSVADASVETGALVACLVVGTIVTPIADRLRLPFAAFAFASVVSLLPGVFLFRMAGGFVGLIASGGNASPELLVSTIANGTTAFLIILAMTVGLIFPRMCIEHFRSGFAKLNPRGSREHLSARNV
jgi:uncharacterized membrane protein YjjB (DUF3815 family)